MDKLINNVLNLLYPPTCGICGKICKDYICNKCSIKIKKYEIKSKNVIKIKEKEKHFNELLCIFRYEDIIRDMLIKYKFQNKPYLYKTFSKIILKNEKTCGFLEKYDIIIPVPISKRRKMQRGYNQTELVAKDIAKMLNIKLGNNILIKKIDTKAQSELSKKDRVINIKNVFRIIDYKTIKDKNILIFDDIYTTGSTANECAKVLKIAGANRVGVLTIAKDFMKEAKDGRISREYIRLC